MATKTATEFLTDKIKFFENVGQKWISDELKLVKLHMEIAAAATWPFPVPQIGIDYESSILESNRNRELYFAAVMKKRVEPLISQYNAHYLSQN